MRVHVLLSTYNGERWLAAQLDSVLAQTHEDLVLVVRDDGSSDGTCRLLQEYAARDARLRWSHGENLGAAASFLLLLEQAREADAVAFCDQDDVWDPDRLKRALGGLAAFGTGPVLWCSDVLVCNEDLTPQRPHALVRRGTSFENALVENVATGCTMVLNRAAADLLAQARPQRPVMHDAWCYLVVAAFGHVVHDPRPSVRYRLHGSNTMGLSERAVTRLAARAARAWSGPHVRAWSRQAEDLRREYGTRLPVRAARELDLFLARDRLVHRLRYAVVGRAHRQRRLGTVAMRLLHVLGRI